MTKLAANTISGKTFKIILKRTTERVQKTRYVAKWSLEYKVYINDERELTLSY